ncbi:MAG: hypothetical protein ACRDVL_10435 [Acidimicrobiia bacterium]
MFFIRILMLFLGVAAVAIATVPLLVLIDLLGGGTGFGLCPGGIQDCEKPFSTGAELVIILAVGLFAVVAGIRILARLARRLQDDSYQVIQ